MHAWGAGALSASNSGDISQNIGFCPSTEKRPPQKLKRRLKTHETTAFIIASASAPFVVGCNCWP